MTNNELPFNGSFRIRAKRKGVFPYFFWFLVADIGMAGLWGGCGQADRGKPLDSGSSNAIETGIAGAGAGGSGGNATITISGGGTFAAGSGGQAGTNTGRGGSGGAVAGVAATAGGGAGVNSGSVAGGGGLATGAAAGGGAGRITDTFRCDAAVYDAQKPPKSLTLSGGNLDAHDPVVIEQNGVFYLHHTGMFLPGKTSRDLLAWNSTSSAFRSTNPAWVAPYVNPQDPTLWAPDLSFFGGQYHLYYSASSYESNKSCIGHATRASMTSGAWSDHGSVVCSNSGGSTDDWNAIDPNVIVDESGKAWLAFGSFWSGIKLIELDETGARANDNLHSIAYRDKSLSRLGGPVEAPYIVRRCGYYYLFVSFDFCCKGADSNYSIRVGRSEKVKGPYVDQSGKKMMEGGGNVLVEGNDAFPGAGHNAVIFVESRAYNIYHAYPANGRPATLRVSEIAWDKDGWPISGGP